MQHGTFGNDKYMQYLHFGNGYMPMSKLNEILHLRCVQWFIWKLCFKLKKDWIFHLDYLLTEKNSKNCALDHFLDLPPNNHSRYSLHFSPLFILFLNPVFLFLGLLMLQKTSFKDTVRNDISVKLPQQYLYDSLPRHRILGQNSLSIRTWKALAVTSFLCYC